MPVHGVSIAEVLVLHNGNISVTYFLEGAQSQGLYFQVNNSKGILATKMDTEKKKKTQTKELVSTFNSAPFSFGFQMCVAANSILFKQDIARPSKLNTWYMTYL